MTDIVIDSRFNGPPDRGNGGYSCGRLAAFIEGPAEVTLRLPPPLERPLEVVEKDDGHVALMDGEALVAEAKPAKLEIDVPAPFGIAAAADAATRYDREQVHPFPTCYVCGPHRAEGEGMRLMPGSAGRDGIVETVWTPLPEHSNDGTQVNPEFLWAALDCPGAVAVMGDSLLPAVLGRLTAEIYRPVPVGRPLEIMAWPIGEDGRKLFAGTALYDEDGELCAAATSIWIVPKN
jgi:hypothetical protein